jgi:hypothetical protein
MMKRFWLLLMVVPLLPGCIIAAKTTTQHTADSMEDCISQCAADFDERGFSFKDHRVMITSVNDPEFEQRAEALAIDMAGEEVDSATLRIERKGPSGQMDQWVGTVDDLPEGESIEIFIDRESMPHAPEGVRIIKLGNLPALVAPSVAPAGRSSLAQELRDLAEAKREGLITDEEFSALRTAVLKKYQRGALPE